MMTSAISSERCSRNKVTLEQLNPLNLEEVEAFWQPISAPLKANLPPKPSESLPRAAFAPVLANFNLYQEETFRGWPGSSKIAIRVSRPSVFRGAKHVCRTVVSWGASGVPGRSNFVVCTEASSWLNI